MDNLNRRTLIAGLAAAGTLHQFSAAPAFSREPALSNPGYILGRGPDGWCDEAKNGGAVVRWHPDDKKWWMWYYARDKQFPADVAPAFGTGRIALAKSEDGIRWTRFQGPLDGGAIMGWSDDPDAFDATHVASGDVLYHNGEWLLWYFGGDTTTPVELGGHTVPESYQYKGYRIRPGVARSKDGLNWTRIQGSATGGASVDIGDNIYGAFSSGIHDGDRYLMYYSTLSPKIFYWETRVAESTDLVNWRDLGLLKWSTGAAQWELGGSNTRHVLPNPDPSGRRWLMVYTALDSRFPLFPRVVGAAESDDGITWWRKYDEPIFYMGPLNNFDSGGTSYPQLVVRDDGRLFLYYYGFASRLNAVPPSRGIGLAISENGDLRNFRRATAEM